jgi:hypothetical protein
MREKKEPKKPNPNDLYWYAIEDMWEINKVSIYDWYNKHIDGLSEFSQIKQVIYTNLIV